MGENVLLADHDYATLRIEAREALWRLGVPSNPGFTNRDILSGLASALGRAFEYPETVEWTEYSGELFRDSLGELVGLDIPPAIPSLVDNLRNVRID
jgi:hypothetical protein